MCAEYLITGLRRPAVMPSYIQKMQLVAFSMWKPGFYSKIWNLVTQSSSSYKLKDQDGRIVSVSKPKEEIDRILTQFNIQVN